MAYASDHHHNNDHGSHASDRDNHGDRDDRDDHGNRDDDDKGDSKVEIAGIDLGGVTDAVSDLLDSLGDIL